MNLANEPILIRTLIGAILGLLVNFGVKLSGVQVESILALTDAVIPLAMAVIGALSARSKVDGPKTAAAKQATIDKLVGAEKTPSRRAPAVSGVFFLVLLALPGCAAFQQAKPVLQTADAVAQQACALFFGERNRMSVEEAAEAFCAAKEQYQPWLDALLRTDRSVERSLPRGE